jgi:hypothetical protein
MEPLATEDIVSPDIQPAKPIDNIIRNTRERGQRMGNALKMVFEKIGFNQKLIASDGVLCLDVGLGPEIEAFRQDNPKIMVVSEELDNLQENLMGREEVLDQLGQGLPFHIVSGDANLGIDYIKSLKTTVGLITHLNTYPKKLTEKYLNGLIKIAPEILAAGGVMLVSATRDDAQKVNSHLEKVVNNQKNNNVDINLLRLGPNEQTIAGQTFLVIKCK